MHAYELGYNMHAYEIGYLYPLEYMGLWELRPPIHIYLGNKNWTAFQRQLSKKK